MYSKAPEKIRKMFDEIAPKYDFMNNVISLGLHNIIKKKAIDKLSLKNETMALDLCCGTGDITNILANKKEIKSVIGIDFSKNMLEIASYKNSHKKIKFVNADCTSLPYADNTFDVITIFFGLRNIENSEKAISEIYRVLVKNGQIMHLDFRKGNAFLNFLFDLFTPICAKLFTKNQDAYKYLIKSKKEFYTTDEIEKMFLKHKLKQKTNYNFLFSTISAQVFEK